MIDLEAIRARKTSLSLGEQDAQLADQVCADIDALLAEVDRYRRLKPRLVCRWQSRIEGWNQCR